ncbi:hypothetical protein R3W88_011498 [Solanum pinnatisectum]|uniref:Ubiquitin-like protease family profile domain-containing protein n=1 Tax=Solanum pinnatisectum TaxID=50273 RepID=A0AAV9L9Y1_9SOLN|nr:hypothetical protein R3W88_011498 [Solanum pinnatisectum]
MHIAVPWFIVDNIFIPVNVKERLCWILIIVSFNECCIMVYDSLRDAIHDSHVLNEIKKYAQLIPMYLSMSGFYEKKGLDVLSQPKYRLHTNFDSFEIVYVNDIPHQPQGSLDCGDYISAYAEFLSDGNGIPAGPFDPDLMRSRYAALLWNYDMLKMQAEAISDSEAPDKPMRCHVNVDSSERITII